MDAALLDRAVEDAMQTVPGLSRTADLGSSRYGFAWFRLAVVYFTIAVLLGVGMGATGNLALYSVHSHLNLLGWESLALIGLIYHHLPDAGRNRIAATQFWLHNTGLPVMMIALAAKGLGDTRMEPVLALSSTIVAAAVVLFAVNVLYYGSRRDRAGARSQRQVHTVRGRHEPGP